MKVFDCNGIEIRKGGKVIWLDPEGVSSGIYNVFENPREDLVKICNEYSECEVYPDECSVINVFNLA